MIYTYTSNSYHRKKSNKELSFDSLKAIRSTYHVKAGRGLQAMMRTSSSKHTSILSFRTLFQNQYSIAFMTAVNTLIWHNRTQSPLLHNYNLPSRNTSKQSKFFCKTFGLRSFQEIVNAYAISTYVCILVALNFVVAFYCSRSRATE